MKSLKILIKHYPRSAETIRSVWKLGCGVFYARVLGKSPSRVYGLKKEEKC